MSSNRNIRVFGNLFAIIAAVAVFGCANQAPTTQDETAPDRMSALMANAAFGGSASNSADWSCPGSANITLKNNIDDNKGIGGWNFTGSQDFTACKSKTTASSYRISGSTSAKQICVYPMQVSGSYNLSLAAQPQCRPVKSGAIVATFPGAKFNYLVIVDEDYSDALDSCLSSSSPCPAHSEGFVE